MRAEPNHPGTTSRDRRAWRSAFTLIEMLTVVGILSLLVAISVISLQHVSRTTKERDTQVVLNTASAMVSELGASGGLTLLTNLYTTTPPLTTMPAPGVVVPGTPGSDPTNPANTALAFTQQVVRILLLNPKNLSIYNQLPKARKLTTLNGQALSSPLLLDGFGNPILFVPPGGLTGVTTGGTAMTVPLQSNQAAPTYFWASAGSDGNFQQGDDNLYSFNQQ
jgi:prepilin-type N-terminal cleavage/methylation domain-containing protein